MPAHGCAGDDSLSACEGAAAGVRVLVCVQDQLRAALQDSLAAKDEEIGTLSMQVGAAPAVCGGGGQFDVHLVTWRLP